MLSRVLDPRDGRPRDPVFWLVLAAIVAVQLLAFWSVCDRQVQQAELRREQMALAGRDAACSRAPSGVPLAGCVPSAGVQQADAGPAPALR